MDVGEIYAVEIPLWKSMHCLTPKDTLKKGE